MDRNAFEVLVKSGLLGRAEPAQVIECDGCERNCFMPVHVRPAEGNRPARAFISCDKPEDVGRVPVELGRLTQWHEQYHVRIVRTPCNLGGRRAWFICPAVGCGRRVAILYGGGIFACRRCYQLAYASSREDAGDRATRRADRLRARLGWEPGILNGEGGKPKWMRWRTFERLAAEHDQLVGRSIQAAALKFGLLLSDFRF